MAPPPTNILSGMGTSGGLPSGSSTTSSSLPVSGSNTTKSSSTTMTASGNNGSGMTSTSTSTSTSTGSVSAGDTNIHNSNTAPPHRNASGSIDSNSTASTKIMSNKSNNNNNGLTNKAKASSNISPSPSTTTTKAATSNTTTTKKKKATARRKKQTTKHSIHNNNQQSSSSKISNSASQSKDGTSTATGTHSNAQFSSSRNLQSSISASNAHANAIKATARLQRIRDARSAVHHDPAWLTSVTSPALPFDITNSSTISSSQYNNVLSASGMLNVPAYANLVPPDDHHDDDQDAHDVDVDDVDDNYGSNGGPLTTMEEIDVVDAALKANGLCRKDLNLEAMGCLMEQARRYAMEIISDASDYAQHAEEDLWNEGDNQLPHASSALSLITSSDLLLAADMRSDKSVANTLPTPYELRMLSDDINRIPLPPIPSNCYGGILLPPQESQLTARTFDVISAAKLMNMTRLGGKIPSASLIANKLAKQDRKPTTGADPNTAANEENRNKDDATDVHNRPVGSGKDLSKFKNATTKKNSTSSYGASRGKQIKVNLKSTTSSSSSAAASSSLSKKDNSIHTKTSTSDDPSGIEATNANTSK